MGLGEKPSIDTLETFIQLQTREVDLSLAQLDRRNALQQMQLFNWGSQRPTQLSLANVNKVTRLEQLAFAQNNLSQQPVEALVSQALQQHPELAIYRIKGQTLDIERRLKREELKPMLNINYNILGNGWAFFPTGTENGPSVLANDIKWGVNFSMPIPNRKARGGVQLATLKIVQNDLYLAQKRQEIENKVRQYHNDLVALRRQLDLLRSMTDNYRRLLDAETEKFGLGESTVFLLNAREQKWLDAQLKYNKLLSEYLKAEVGLLWAMGNF
jgi:outer membrane protein TolC